MNSQVADDFGFRGSFFMGLILTTFTLFLAMPSFAKDYSFSWTANDSQVEGYKFYYKKEGFAGPPFDGNEANEGESPICITDLTSFNISGLEDNTTYHFALTAYDGSDESDFTQVITVFPGNGQDDQDERMGKMVTIINTHLLLN